MRLARFMNVLLRDDTGATALEYVVAAVALVFAAIVIFASRSIADVLVSFLQVVHITATQAVP
jgi:Flp pilus assembly pilin Flp